MPFKYPLPQIPEFELQRDYPHLWETIKKEFPTLPVEQWVRIGRLVVGTCGHCHDAASGCQCWNDE